MKPLNPLKGTLRAGKMPTFPVNEDAGRDACAPS